MTETKDLKLAVLIDADNIPSAHIEGMLEEIAKFGIPTIKRIYGDWTSSRVSGWKTSLLEHAIIPIQQYGYTRGKNSTDSAMIIDAMDILHSEKVDGFCIVSSDSDFTRLAMRIRESGKLVIGIGEKKTPQPFIVACDKFIYIEIIASTDQETEEKKSKDGASTTRRPAQKQKVDRIDKSFLRLLKRSVDDVEDDDGWASLAAVGALINKKKPDFDPRNYGFSKLSTLIKSLNKQLELDERKDQRSGAKHIYLRMKKPS
ncbi:MAG: NYN domain-containing protein [Bacteroidetes bacterium]|nr:MAG: NYN domain-containing protein [Bacteroidota bacterium]